MMTYYANYGFGAFPQLQYGGCAPQQPPYSGSFALNPASFASYGSGCGSAGGSGFPSINQQQQPQQQQQQQQQQFYAGQSYSTTSDNEFAQSMSNQMANLNSNNSYQMQTPSFNYAGNGCGGYAATGYAGSSGFYQPPAIQPQASSYIAQARTSSQTNLTVQQGECAPSTLSNNGNGEEVTPQIEAAYEAATGQQRRQPVVKRQVITVPGAPGRVQQIVRRLPTPTPDVVERVFVVKPQRDVVNLIIERPCTPPAQFRDRTVIGKQRKPVIHPMIVRVPGRPAIQGQPQQQQQQQQPICYPSQFVQALPAPPIINVQHVRVPPSGSTASYQYQHPVQSSSQPTLSSHHQHIQCGGSGQQASSPTLQHDSQSQLQASQTNLAPSSSSSQHHQQQSQQSNAASPYVVAPVQYAENWMAAAASIGYLPAPTQQPQAQIQPAQYPTGYSTGFPMNQNFFSPQMNGLNFSGYGSIGCY